MKKTFFNTMFLRSVIAVICITGAVKIGAQAVISQLNEMTTADAAAKLLQPVLAPVDCSSQQTLAKDLTQNGTYVVPGSITVVDFCGYTNKDGQYVECQKVETNMYPLVILNLVVPDQNAPATAAPAATATASPQASAVKPDPCGHVRIIKVPASSPVVFCSSKTYNKQTGACSDGKAPYKVVPITSLKDPASKIPNVICREPMVPTFNPASKIWQCIVPPGFKLNRL